MKIGKRKSDEYNKQLKEQLNLIEIKRKRSNLKAYHLFMFIIEFIIILSTLTVSGIGIFYLTKSIVKTSLVLSSISIFVFMTFWEYRIYHRRRSIKK
jgi:hypothetical protein